MPGESDALPAPSEATLEAQQPWSKADASPKGEADQCFPEMNYCSILLLYVRTTITYCSVLQYMGFITGKKDDGKKQKKM